MDEKSHWDLHRKNSTVYVKLHPRAQSFWTPSEEGLHLVTWLLLRELLTIIILWVAMAKEHKIYFMEQQTAIGTLRIWYLRPMT